MARIVFTPNDYITVEDNNSEETNGHKTENGNHINGTAKCNGVNNHSV
jgi:hypothetical protein